MKKYESLKKFKDEKFKDVIGYEDHYLVSSYGRVFSKNYHQVKGRIQELIQMTHFDKKRGYRYKYVELKNKSKMIHNIVAEAFHGEKKIGMQVNHKDGNIYNNKASNLEYVTQSENIRHAFDNNLYKRSKLTKKLAKEIYLEIKKTKISLRQCFIKLAKKHSVPQSCINSLYYKKSWGVED